MAAAVTLLSASLRAAAQQVPSDSTSDSTPSPDYRTEGTAAPAANRAELARSTPLEFVPPASPPAQQGESEAVSRGPAMMPTPNVSAAASYSRHYPTAAPAAPGPRRDFSASGDGLVPQGRRVSDVRDTADRNQIRSDKSEISQGERDIRRGQLLIQDGEKPGHDRREAAEGAQLEWKGNGEVMRGQQAKKAAARDLHRDEIAAHRVGMGPSPGRNPEVSKPERRPGQTDHPVTTWRPSHVVKAQKKWGSE